MMTNECQLLFKHSQDEKYWVDIVDKIAPHLVRAERLKTNYLLNSDREVELRRAKEVNLDLAKESQLQETIIKEHVMRVEMLEQKLDIAKKQVSNSFLSIEM